jgi:hypothetical protein
LVRPGPKQAGVFQFLGNDTNSGVFKLMGTVIAFIVIAGISFHLLI